MGDDPTRITNPRPDAPRRRALGLAMLVLTLSGGYALAERAVEGPLAEVVEAMDPDDERATLSMSDIMAEIDTVAARHRVPPRLVAAIIAVESEFNPRAVSRRGARGLMQLMPATAASVDVQDAFDARENIEGGVRHLRTLMDRYQNDLPVVLAAYNAGDRAVIAHQGVPPYRETRQYVIRVLRRYDRAAARAAAARIYGTGARSSVPTVSTRLVSYEGPVPLVVRYRYQPDAAGEAASASIAEIAPRRIESAEAAPRRTESPELVSRRAETP